MSYEGRTIFRHQGLTIREHGPGYVDVEMEASSTRIDKASLEQLLEAMRRWSFAGVVARRLVDKDPTRDIDEAFDEAWRLLTTGDDEEGSDDKGEAPA